MYSKTLIWIGLFVGSTIGAYIPMLWGAGTFSYSSVVFSAIGGISGIWLGVKFSSYI